MSHSFHAACKRAACLSLAALPALALVACAPAEEVELPPQRLVIASTTSTQDSGLFDVLIPAFEEAHPEHDVAVLAVGTGEALELGRMRDADVLLVHAKTAEEEFVRQGFGTDRADVMYNDFVIVGPADDPAGASETSSAADALLAILLDGGTFVSRGDESGTHHKEMALWEAAGMEPGGEDYVSTGQGMGAVLAMANELGAYTLSDRATYLNMLQNLRFEIVSQGDPALFNQYGVVIVADATNPSGAQAFYDWVTDDVAQSIIGNYGVQRFGEPLFMPNAEG